MRSIKICFLSVIIIISSCTTSPKLDELAINYKNVLNSHNVDSLMAYYHDDIIFDIPDLSMNLKGKAELRGVAEYDSALNTIMELSNISVANDTIYCSIRETNKWLDAAGIEAAYYPEAYFVAKEYKISHLYADLSDTVSAQFAQVFTDFLPWVRENRYHEYALMMPEGRFIFNAENALKMVELLTAWRETGK